MSFFVDSTAWVWKKYDGIAPVTTPTIVRLESLVDCRSCWSRARAARAGGQRILARMGDSEAFRAGRPNWSVLTVAACGTTALTTVPGIYSRAVMPVRDGLPLRSALWPIYGPRTTVTIASSGHSLTKSSAPVTRNVTTTVFSASGDRADHSRLAYPSPVRNIRQDHVTEFEPLHLDVDRHKMIVRGGQCRRLPYPFWTLDDRCSGSDRAAKRRVPDQSLLRPWPEGSRAPASDAGCRAARNAAEARATSLRRFVPACPVRPRRAWPGCLACRVGLRWG